MRKKIFPRLATIAILALMTVNLTGCGSESPQELVASAKAYLSALNKLQSKADRVAAQG